MRLRELSIQYRPVAGAPAARPQIQTAADVAALLTPIIGARHVEHFGVLTLDTKHRVIGWDVVGLGTVDSCIVHPREVFLAAIAHHAAAIIVAHNHPSGDPSPSHEDIAITSRLRAAGDLLGLPVLDSVIIGAGRFVSLRELGHF